MKNLVQLSSKINKVKKYHPPVRPNSKSTVGCETSSRQFEIRLLIFLLFLLF